MFGSSGAGVYPRPLELPTSTVRYLITVLLSQAAVARVNYQIPYSLQPPPPSPPPPHLPDTKLST